MKLKVISLIGLCYAAGITSCTSTKASSSKDEERIFDYCEIYMPETLGKNGKNLGLNSVDFDWGIWGHNLSQVLPDDASMNVYAKGQQGHSTKEQFCFSSNTLYKYIEEYIVDNFGETETMRIAIMPNDNEIVCLCEKCVKAGNTAGNASPAVFSLVRRLCDRFPNHIFFTSDYMTTKSLPDTPLPTNSGVLISAMDYPRTAFTTPEEMAFMKRVSDWDKKVGHVYIWDYINNFDDYFTPVPLYNIMSHRLQKYAENGVDGVFFNGAGSDYSSFGGIDTHMLIKMLSNPSIDWRSEAKAICDTYYPVAGDIIFNFIVAQDNYFLEKGRPLPMYDGVSTALNTYLPADEFIEFYNSLLQVKDRAQGEERARLDKLIGALSLTRLEIARLQGNVDGYENPMSRLASLINSRIESYNESMWSIADYIHDYSFMARHAKDMENRNLLKGKLLQSKTPLDEEYSDISILTDGMLGLPSNYHSGNMISSADPSLILEIPYVDGMKNIRVGMTSNQSYHIGLPSEVRLSYEGHTIGTAVPKRLREHGGHSFVEFSLPANVRGPMLLTVVRNPEHRTMALDEIEGY